jgi:cytochrome b
MPATQIRVWDPVVRLCHWGLVIFVVLAWTTRHGGGRWHEWSGHALGAIVALRVMWGWIGPPYARFAQFLRSPAATARYAMLVVTRREPRHLGHNPLGGWMVVLLLTAVTLTVATGWLYITDEFWGVSWIETLHGASADALLMLATVHLAGVLFTSVRQRENLVAAMIHGRKRAEPNRSGL